MQNRDSTRLKHILDSTRNLLLFIEGRERPDLLKDILFFSAVLKQLEIIGEASVKLSEDTKNKYPDIPWKKMIGMRNHLIHEYFDIDPDTIWVTITVEIPILFKKLEVINLANTDL